MRRLLLHPEAQKDLEDAAEWHQGHSPRGAGHLLEEVQALLESLADHPLRHPRLFASVEKNAYRRARVRSFPYSVIYLATDDLVEVVAIAHDRRDPGYWRHRRPSTVE